MKTEADWYIRRYPVTDKSGDVRSPYERDFARIVHSAAFRRLQGKTQIIGIGDHDFYRTRLTHSVEAAQIASGILMSLTRKTTNEAEFDVTCPDALIRSIALVHDIGHPPFGHGGEVILYYKMSANGGFEGNAQSLRIVSKLETSSERGGLNLTRRSLLGILKYPVPYSLVVRKETPASGANRLPIQGSHIFTGNWHPPKCHFDEDQELVDWILDPLSSEDRREFTSFIEPESKDKHARSRYRSLDASIANLADEIAYGVHDLEDAIYLQFIHRDEWEEAVGPTLTAIGNSWLKNNGLGSANELTNNLFAVDGHKRKGAISALVNTFVQSTELIRLNVFEHPVLDVQPRQNEECQKLSETLREFVYTKFIKQPHVQTQEFSGQRILSELFDAYISEPERLLPVATIKRFRDESLNGAGRLRVICDHLSSMTNEYATRMYERLFVPRHGSVFQRM